MDGKFEAIETLSQNKQAKCTVTRLVLKKEANRAWVYKEALLTECAHGIGKVGSVPQESPPRPLQTAGLGAGAHTIVPILLRPA